MQCRAAIGAAHVLTDDADIAALPDRLAPPLHRPRAAPCCARLDADEVAAHRAPVRRAPRADRARRAATPAWCWAACRTPAARAIVLSLTRLNRIRAHRPGQQHDDGRGRLHPAATSSRRPPTPTRLFPLSLAAEGSCTIGGNLSTNAGGTGVLRYGNTRELCLGPGSRHAAGRNLERPARPAQGQYRLRPARPVHRRRRHARHHHRRRAEAVSAAEGAHHGAGGDAYADDALRAADAGASAVRRRADRLRADVGLLPATWSPGISRSCAQPFPRSRTRSMCCWNCPTANRKSTRWRCWKR